MHTDPIRIHIGQGFEKGHALHLVGHLVHAQVAMDHAFESMTPIGGSSSIDREEHITPQGHVNVPSPHTVHPITRH